MALPAQDPQVPFAPEPRAPHNRPLPSSRDDDRNGMSPPRELKLLRLAVARGLVTWDDVERAAERATERAGGTESPAEGDLDPAAWLEALVEEGRLEDGILSRLEAEAEADTASRAVAGGARAVEPLPPPAGRADREADSRIARDLEVLEDWDRYEVITFLGAGGMGSVYKVFDPSLKRFAAVKILHRSEPGLKERLLREARAQARIDHPHVCQVYEVGEVRGRPYIAMQYIDGERLDEAIAGLPHDLVARLFADVARAVHAAHRNGLVHRDLKPGNILVARRSSGELHPFVVDFGLARDLEEPSAYSRTDVITGTPAYLAPEQIRGQGVDRCTDVFSLGVVLFEALTGRTPFSGASVAETLVKITGEEPPPPRKLEPALPRDLETLLLRCLEKDPARRYASAQALADDLERYLAGEPILARRPTLTYRLGKRLRKNRALAAVAALAVVAVLLMAAWSLRTAWLARERAELAQRFGQEVQEVESSLRHALLLPLHDTSAHKEALRARAEWIEREMDRLGDLARGPGHHALGQVHLALHEHEEAREHLEAAWASGFREPEVAAALGRALGHLYTRALTEGQVAAGTPERRAYLQEIQEAYREPAVSFLKQSSAGSESTPAYVEGLIALFEERYADALAFARRATRESSTLGEARQLEGEVHVIQGNEALEQGRYEEALALYDRAGEVYGELLETYRSDAGLHAAECGRRIQRLEVLVRVGRLPEDEVAGALAACDRALVADPRLAEAHAKRARIHWRAAEDRADRGEDPRPELERAVEAARAAIELDPRDVNAHAQLSIANRRLADWRMGRGQDPTDALESAVQAARQAVALVPARETAHLILGNAYQQRARHLRGQGEDPRPDLDRAIDAYRRAVELNPRMTTALTNLGGAWKARGDYEIDRGLDPTGSVDRAREALEAALEVNPTSASIHNNLGTAHLTYGYHLLSRGDDPGGPLNRAAESFRRALEINPEYLLGVYNLAFTERCLARYRLQEGRDPGPALERARDAVARAVEINPAEPDVFVEAARVEEIAAEWAVARGLPAEGALRPGLEAAERALGVHPEMAEALAVRGALRLLEARTATDPASARERAGRAAADLEAALDGNPLLENEYGDAAREARRLAGGG